MKTPPLLSIIIPVHNGEEFIDKCMDKVLKINIKKEIIVINDFSTDNSANLLNKYSSKIYIYSFNKNKGVSAARNYGIKKARGLFITFVDIDDDFEINMHDKLVSKLITTKSDICICGNDIIDENKNTIKSKNDLNFKVFSQYDVIKKYLLDKFDPSVWSSVYRTKLAKKIFFNENIKIGEDILFELKYLLLAKKTSFIQENLYHYVQRSSSAMHNLSLSFVDYIRIHKLLTKKELYILNKFYKKEFTYFKLKLIQRCVHAISFNSKTNKKLAIKLLKDACSKQDCISIFRSRFSHAYVKFEFIVIFIFGFRFHLLLFPLYIFLRKMRLSSRD